MFGNNISARRRALVSVLAAGLVAVATVPVAAQTSSLQPLEAACLPSNHVFPTAHSNLNRSTLSLHVHCLQWWGLNPYGYAGEWDGGAEVTRAEFAEIERRFLEQADAPLPTQREPVRFEDIDGHPYEAAIVELASRGVIKGVSDTRFNPDGLIRRDQMASLIVRLHESMGFRQFELAPSPSDVRGSTHEGNIRALLGSGIAEGRSDGVYDPTGQLTRDQIGIFTMRHASWLVERDLMSRDPGYRYGTGFADYRSGDGDGRFNTVGFDIGEFGVLRVTKSRSPMTVTFTDTQGRVSSEFDIVEDLVSIAIPLNFTGLQKAERGNVQVETTGSWTMQALTMEQHLSEMNGFTQGVTGNVVDLAPQRLTDNEVRVDYRGFGPFKLWLYDDNGNFIEEVVNSETRINTLVEFPSNARYAWAITSEPWLIYQGVVVAG